MSDAAILALAVALVGVGVVIWVTGDRAVNEARATRETIDRVDRNTAPLFRAGSRLVEGAEDLGLL